ncbi:MAG: hypothetical protein JSW58_08210 [Candidatus Latescibacterota bacterium]|nr:MAG: hypothetical protein JSW58_08210 [Candidatus Latescibacterota bacterium]
MTGSRLPGAEPRTVMTRAPLRISFVGGGSDLPGGRGATVSASINLYVYCIARWRNDRRVYLSWREKEIVGTAEDLKHDLIRESLLMFGIREGIEIITFADIPGVGSGLGSSAATTVAMIRALCALKGYGIVDSEWLAELACDVELHRLGRSGGRQDQYASAVGGLLLMNFEDGKVSAVQRLADQLYELKILRDHLLLFRLKEGRNSEEILCEFQDCERFRSECVELVEAFCCQLNSSRGDLEPLGRFFYDHHNLKREYFPGYMGKNLDSMLTDFFGTNFKLCGAGGTGHILVGTSPEKAEDATAQALSTLGSPIDFEFTMAGAEVLYVG